MFYKNDSKEIEKERLLFHLTFEDGTTLKSIPDKDHRRENYGCHKLTGRNKWANMSKQRAQMLTAGLSGKICNYRAFQSGQLGHCFPCEPKEEKRSLPHGMAPNK